MTVAQPSLFVIAIVLGAAFLHALWNAMVKRSKDRFLTLGLVNLGQFILGLVMVAMFMAPSEASWLFLIASTLIHFFYYGFLLLSYQHGDLSHVYPIARGSAPVLVSLGAYIFIGETLPFFSILGITVVCSGIGLLFLGNNHNSINKTALYAALGTGFIIATYTVVDGAGVRVSQSPFGYIGWLFILEGLSSIYFLSVKRHSLTKVGARYLLTGLAGGLISAIAYALAIYAMSMTQLANVSAIRESSVIMAALIGVVWLGERPWKMRIVAATIVACGVIIISMADG